jgi:hypothetical protein
MTTTADLERLLREALTDHAEAAMNQTDTQHELDVFEAAAERDRHRERPRSVLALTGLAAAAAVIVGAVLWDGGSTTQEPAPPVSPEPTRAESVAADFLAAYDGDDRSALRSFLAEDADIVTSWNGYGGIEGLMRSSRWDAAFGRRMVSVDCVELGPGADGGTKVSCTETSHAGGSEELGRGPWTGDVTFVTVEADLVTEYSINSASNRNGYQEEMYAPLDAWMTANHADQLDLLLALDDPAADPATVRSALELWERYIEEYVAAVLAGEAE